MTPIDIAIIVVVALFLIIFILKLLSGVKKFDEEIQDMINKRDED